MDAIYFVTMLVGVAWICAWVAVEKPDPGFGWWPFDMLEDKPDAERAAEAQAAAAKAGRPGAVARQGAASQGGSAGAARAASGAARAQPRGTRGAQPLPGPDARGPAAATPASSGRGAPVTSWRDRVAGRGGDATGTGGGQRDRSRGGPGAGAPPGRRRP